MPALSPTPVHEIMLSICFDDDDGDDDDHGNDNDDDNTASANSQIWQNLRQLTWFKI